MKKAKEFIEQFLTKEAECWTMGVKLNSLTMKVIGWKGNIYNPSDLDIKKLGKFIATERYSEPGNYDNFSLNEYLKEA